MDRIAVVGPGAIGTIVAARLAPHADVTVVCRTSATAKAIKKHGLQISQDGEAQTVPVATTTRVPDADLSILATRCQDAVATARKQKADVVVAMQNGLMGDALAPVLGDRLLMCTVAFPATRTGVGTSAQTGPGGLHVGAWPTGGSAHAQPVADILSHVAPTHVHGNMEAVGWSKLLINSCITSLGALTGEGLGRILGDRTCRDLFLGIVREGRDVAAAQGVKPVALGSFRPGLLANGALGHAMLRLAARKHVGHRSSSLQSLERGGATEVAYLNGRIVADGAACGIATPVNAAVLAAVQEVEAGAAPSMARAKALR